MKILKLLKNNAVLCVAIVAAVITAFIVPPDEKYAGYFDLSTLYCLFGTLAVVEGLARIGFFEFLARKIVVKFKNLRAVTFALVFITYFGSMVMANDMALITFLPLGYYALESTQKRLRVRYAKRCRKPRRNAYAFRQPAKPVSLFLL